MLGPCDFQQAPEAETDENKEVPRVLPEILTTHSAQKSPCRQSLSQGRKGWGPHEVEGATTGHQRAQPKAVGGRPPMSQLEQLLGFRAHGRASRDCLARYRAPGLTHTKAQRDVGCPARVPHGSTKRGHTAYTGGQGTQPEQRAS